MEIINQLETATAKEVAASAQRSHGAFDELEFGMRVRRIAMTFSYLEYLADKGQINREEDAQGSFPLLADLAPAAYLEHFTLKSPFPYNQSYLPRTANLHLC